jgi:zinc/manganese transport system substrate-binding protein
VLKPAVLLVATVLAVGLGGCAGTTADPGADGVIRVVASTNVYGDLAELIGGPYVEVTSVIDDPAQDPHEFEANARVQLAVSRADVVIANGGGYDDFMGTMLDASDNEDAIVVTAVDAYPHDPDVGDEGFNEHVWYDYEAMIGVVGRISDALSEVDPHLERKFTGTMFTLTGLLQGLGADADLAAETVAGSGVIVTEPVPVYLLHRMGLENLTPSEFSDAVEEDTDVAPAVLRDVLDRIRDGSVDLVVYNAQTGGPLTDAVLEAAEAEGVPAVAVSETLPEGMHYVGWQQSVQRDIVEALDG